MNLLSLIPDKYRFVVAVVAALLLAVAIFAGGWNFGADVVQGEWDSANVKQAKLQAESELASRNKERLLQKEKDEALNAAAEREIKIQADADAAHAAVLSLRGTVTNLRSQLSGATVEACRGLAEAALDVFGQCAEEYRAVAKAADRFGSSAQTLNDAWPQ